MTSCANQEQSHDPYKRLRDPLNFMKFIYFANLDSIAASNKRIIMRRTWSIEKPHFFHLTYVYFGESSCSFVRWAQSIRAQLKAYSSAYFVKNISTLLFLRHLSTLENYSRFFTLDFLLSTLDIYSRLSTFTLDIYSRLFTLDVYSRPSTFRYTLPTDISYTLDGAYTIYLSIYH